MHATNIIQQVCSITRLENIFCCCALNCCFDLYEIAVLAFMMWQASSSRHCLDVQGETDQVAASAQRVYICLVVNCVIYWGFFVLSLGIKLHSCCSSPDKKDAEKEVEMEEMARNGG